MCKDVISIELKGTNNFFFFWGGVIIVLVDRNYRKQDKKRQKNERQIDRKQERNFYFKNLLLKDSKMANLDILILYYEEVVKKTLVDCMPS